MLNIQSICKNCSHLKLGCVREFDNYNSSYLKDIVCCDLISHNQNPNVTIFSNPFLSIQNFVKNDLYFYLILLPESCPYFLEHALHNENI